MDVLNFDDHNILLNGQPYPFNSIRPRFPVATGDNVAALYFPWWQNLALWSGDVTRLKNGHTGLPFTGIADFRTFCSDHFYTDAVAALHFLGAWDASTNTPTLANGDANPSGDFYITSVGGTVDFGAGNITFAANDLVVYNGSIWQNGGPATILTLEQVTAFGNSTTNGINFKDGGGNLLASVATPGGASPSTIGTLSVDASTGVIMVTMPDNSLNELGFFNATGDLSLRADAVAGSRIQQFQNNDGTIALEETMDLQKVTDTGNVTSNGIIFTDGSGNALAIITTPGGTGASVIATESTDNSTGLAFVTNADNSVNAIEFFRTGGDLTLIADATTASRLQQFQDSDGTIALEETMTLQKATTAGNTTTDGIAFEDGSGNVLAFMGPYLGYSVLGTRSTDTTTAVSFITKPDNSVNAIGYTNAGGTLDLFANTLTGARLQQFPDKDGTIALTSDLIGTVNAQTGTTYTPVLSDAENLVTCNNASPVTITIPTNASVAYPVGTRIDFVQLGAGKVSFTAAGGVTINSQGGNLSIFDQYVGVTIIQIVTDTWLLIGNLSA